MGKKIVDSIKGSKSQASEIYQELIDQAPGGITVFSSEKGKKAKLLYFNNLICELSEMDETTIKKADPFSICHAVDEDMEKVMSTIKKAESGEPKHDGNVVYRSMSKEGKIRYIQLNVNVIDKPKNTRFFYLLYIDVTSEKETEEALRISNEKFRVATKNSDVSFWTYDFNKKEIIQSESSMKHHGSKKNIKDIPESLIKSGYVHKKSVNNFAKMYESLESGAKTASGDFWFKTEKSDGWWCEHIDYTSVFDHEGNPLRAYAIGKDITPLKRAEKRYAEEMAYAKATESKGLLVKVRSNISKNVVESYTAKKEVRVSSAYMPYTIATENLARTGYTTEDQNKIRSHLNRERVLRAFNEGEHMYSIDYRRRTNDDNVIWVNTTVKSFKNPETGEIMSFMYTYDINEHRIKDGIIEAVTSFQYDYIAYIDLKRDTYKLYIGGEDFEQILPTKIDNYEESVYEVNKAVVVPEDVDRAIADMLPKGIRENLKKQKEFSTVYSVYDENKNIRQKRLQYTYLDKSSEQVICTRTDVTELLENQKQQQHTLETALLAAEQANSAKSDFLSRMSHEIRTPMNAIIGMSTIAAQSIGNDEQIADCISKIGISSRFLLSLINDILDMSRIESGKLLLKSEKIVFEDFINQINSICYPQAEKKDIDYECIIDSSIEDYYIGDAMKLQQVIINILSNGIKFTPHNGRVVLNVNQVKKSKKGAIVRFVINDTGCGISEEFRPHLYEAFAQEHVGTTSQYGGTGLGLSICKNLVDMMNGHIEVRSIVGVGTEFSVDVTLGITEESKSRYLDKTKYTFNSLRTLVVDDDVAVCNHSVKILSEMGVKAQWVDSGAKAIEIITNELEEKRHFDLVLLDWKMPEMDGIEAAKRIRKIVGPDITIIIMTAYDWANIETAAKEAGVNLLISKPMFKSNLLYAFEKIRGNQVEKETEIGDSISFDGKRVLVAEDHPLNLEVLKKLLEIKGFEVEHAENGLRALEMFTISPTGYYDAILMDIRMPVMDGIQSTNAIRHLSKKDAKTVPIIAITANAFEEDINRTKKVGMDAHIAKPIEPNHMYQVLYDLIYNMSKN